MTTTSIRPDQVFPPSGYYSREYAHPYNTSNKGFLDGITDESFMALVSVGANLVVGGLWTWASIAAFGAGPLGWTIAGCLFAAFAAVNYLVALGSLFSMLG